MCRTYAAQLKLNENKDQDDENLLDIFKLLCRVFAFLFVVRLNTYFAQLQLIMSNHPKFAHKLLPSSALSLAITEIGAINKTTSQLSLSHFFKFQEGLSTDPINMIFCIKVCYKSATLEAG